MSVELFDHSTILIVLFLNVYRVGLDFAAVSAAERKLTFQLKSLAAGLNHFCDPLERPIDFFPCDNERRPNADDVIVSLLAQNSFVLQGFTIGASVIVEFDTDP